MFRLHIKNPKINRTLIHVIESCFTFNFSFSTFEELETDDIDLLKRIQKFSLAQDGRARDAPYIFTRISFAIAKGA